MTTNQEAFDLVYAYAKTMKEPAINDQENCCYRSPNGPCLIGSLIKDEFYHEGIEDKHAGTKEVIEVLKKSGIFMEDDHFLLSLQTAHDDVVIDGCEEISFNAGLLKNLNLVAEEYNLVIPE